MFVAAGFHVEFVEDGAVRQGEDLEAAAVCDDGAVAVDEFVEATAGLDYVWPRLEEEVVGIAEGEFLACFIPPVVVDGFEGAVGGDGDKAGGVDDAVGGVQASDPCARPFFFGLMQQLEAEKVFALVGGEGLGGRREGHGVELDLALLLLLGEDQGGLLGRRSGAGGAGRRAAAGRGRAGGQAAVRRETAAHRQERRTGSGRLHLAGVDVVRLGVDGGW